MYVGNSFHSVDDCILESMYILKIVLVYLMYVIIQLPLSTCECLQERHPTPHSPLHSTMHVYTIERADEVYISLSLIHELRGFLARSYTINIFYMQQIQFLLDFICMQ